MHYSGDATAIAPSSFACTAFVRLALFVSLRFPWSMANNLNDILITQFKRAFERSDFQAGLVQRAFYLGFFLFAIPAGMFKRRYGYEAAVIPGLSPSTAVESHEMHFYRCPNPVPRRKAPPRAADPTLPHS